ncbi:hypothetical protein A2U01_0112013, partial [Trifolium medium]|nr:hypothetical protein [Trifolium medium]
FLARRAGVLARRAGKASGSWVGSGLCARRSSGWRYARYSVQVWLWPLSFAPSSTLRLETP